MLFQCAHGCSVDIGMTRAREGQHRCDEHGAVLTYAKALGSKPSGGKKPMKRSQPDRDWTDARAKVEEEGACRVCHRNADLQAAHVIGRASDQPKRKGAKKLWVNPDSIVPLCGEFGHGPRSCHRDYDAHALDLLPYLTVEEQVQAVRDAGGIEGALRRIDPFAFKPLTPQTPKGGY